MNLNISTLTLFCILTLISISPKLCNAQVRYEHPVNIHINFANESTHGMLIAHRILEGFNQKVNAFVDLQSNQFNFYGNKDLPKDIFEDPEHWFYPISPNSYYSSIKAIHASSKDFPHKSELYAIAKDMHTICMSVNKMRFSMEDYMIQNDLTLVEHQIGIFTQLQHCASLYDRYYEVNDQLHNLINLIVLETNSTSERRQRYDKIQKSLKSSLEAIRYGFDNELDTDIAILTKQNTILQKEIARDRPLAEIQTALKEGLLILNDYKKGLPIPEKYTLYGPAYYYYNVELASVVNRYGKGLIANANKILFKEDPDQILLLEEPHYFKVVLPKKEIPLEQSKEVIKTLPSKLEKRKVAISQTTIEVKQKKLLLEIFDHRQEDGDIISLNFNGHWILEEKQLKKSPLKIVVELNDEGENYLILHAVNLGELPPNTIAVRYYLDGIRKMVVLNSDLNQSEMIRIKRITDDN